MILYEQFYHFSAEPFRLSPDHAFAYAHKGYTKARAYLSYAFLRAEGFVMITGRPGTGKTTLIGTLIAELANESVHIANLVCTQLQADELLKLVAYDFGISPTIVEKGELLQHLTQQLKRWHRDGRRALLIVDEAQDLPACAMEELRLLTNIQVDSRPLLQIFLLGQPELRELILHPRMEQVHQRVIAATHLQALACDETEAYVRHRLDVVDWAGDPTISKPVYPLIHQFSEGIPRRINQVCSRLLLHCAVEQQHQVKIADMRTVAQELQDENLTSGPHFKESDFWVEDIFEESPHKNGKTISGAPDACDDIRRQRAEPVAELKLVAIRGTSGNFATPQGQHDSHASRPLAFPEPDLEEPIGQTVSSRHQKPDSALSAPASETIEISSPISGNPVAPVEERLCHEALLQKTTRTSSDRGAKGADNSASPPKSPVPTPSTWPIMTILLIVSLTIAWAIAYFTQ
ncbi:MAG: AAA family ATPase [Porticoccaceae bacterium]